MSMVKTPFCTARKNILSIVERIFSYKLISIIALMSAFLGVLLMCIRIWYACSFSEPIQSTTSGWEAESLYSMWKYVNGMDIYTDKHAVPYAASVYNWLYYQFYGIIIRQTLSLFSLSAWWIPTIGRFITLAGVLVGCCVCYVSFRKMLTTKGSSITLIVLSFSLLVFIGPLVGFWGFTVRPDVWSFTLEVIGVFLFWKYYSQSKLKAVLFSAFALYCSWAFKQSGVSAVVAISLFLMLKKEFKPCSVFVVLMICFYGITFLLGDKEYFNTVLYHGEREISSEVAIKYLLMFARKSIPATITVCSSLVVILSCKKLRRGILENDIFLFSVIFLLTTIIIVVPASMMEGAADNYYFIVIYSLSLMAVILVDRISEYKLNESEQGEKNLWAYFGFLIFGWTVHAVALMMVLTGHARVLSVYPKHCNTVRAQRFIERLPKPLFVDDKYLSLPWMNPSVPYVFTNWSYKKDRESGVLFKDGGIGGLIKRDHYKTLLLGGKVGFFDGADLSEYVVWPVKYEGFYVYVRKGIVANPY
jgi:hypothetical protein